MAELAPALLMLPPIAVAAGVDLYLTLLMIGAAPTLGLWPLPLVGALGDLDSPSVLIIVGCFYLLEFAAERFPPASLSWNALHAVIRPVSGALLALLLLDGEPLLVLATGALAGGVIASVAHGVRSGWAMLRWLRAGVAPSVLVVSLAEDALVIGLVSVALDTPQWAVLATMVGALLLLRTAPSLLRAFAYAVSLAVERLFRPLRQRRWLGPDELPTWVGPALEHDGLIPPGAAIRGTRAAGWRIDGRPRFLVGWVVVRGDTRVFLTRLRGRVTRLDLGRFGVSELLDQELFRRLDLHDTGQNPFLLFGSVGPGTEGLRAEFPAS